MRLPDWETRLHDVLASWRERSFRWDRDCARFMAAFVKAQTGVDPIADLRSQYRTKRAALKILAAKSMEERLDAQFPRIHTAFAQRGDIALVQDMCLGCVIGDSALFFGEDGMTTLPRSEWQGVWGVGRDG